MGRFLEELHRKGGLFHAFAAGCLLLSLATTASAAGTATSADQDAPPDPTKASSNPLSDAGTSGFFLYRKHCQGCHGYLGSGTDKLEPLLGSRYSKDHTERQAFHREFRHSSRDHIKVARGTRKKPGPRFNELELIGKFLREIDAWHAMLKENSTGD